MNDLTENISIEHPLVSIAMCTYNGEQFLKEQMDSLIIQDYPNLEIIITDDCSTDSTMEILQGYEQKHDHIKVFKNEYNLGFKKNFEKTILSCSGEFISLCDQDDIWFPNKVSSQLNDIGNYSLIYSKLSTIDEKGNPIKKTILENRLSGKCHLGLLFANCVTGHVSLIRKETAVQALPIPKKVQYHDHWIAFIAASQNGIKASEKTLSLYRVHDNNASMKMRNKKNTNFLKRKKERIYRAKIKLSNLIGFLEAILEKKIVNHTDKQAIKYLLSQIMLLRVLPINNELRNHLIEHKHIFLSIYLEPNKRAKKLSRGIWFYRLKI